MATHAESKNQGTIIVDSDISIDNLNNSSSGLSVQQLMTMLPQTYDISNLCDGSTKIFHLAPAVVKGTLSFFNLYLNGVLLTRSADNTSPDYTVLNHSVIELHTTVTAPSTGDSLIVVYIGVI
tara:strand:- start:2240 stop:2608 length:369 start_codon:yes stop_codon:yes gene_type:complete